MAITSSVQELKKKVTLEETKPMKMRQKGITLEKTEEKKILPSREKLNKRDPMGMYIVPQGEKPLTCLEFPLPGPADYSPNADLTKGSLPQYSLVGRPKTPPVNKKSPGPADYNTSGNLRWKRKSVTLKGRGRSCFEDEVAKSYGDVGSIKVESLGVGSGGPKYSVGVKRSKIFTGPPNSLVQPQDYSAFSTPGPNYRPNSAYWGRGPKKSFGAGRDDIDLLDSRISYPGPGDYEIYTPRVGPSYSFGRKLPPPPSVLEGNDYRKMALHRTPTTSRLQSELALHLPLEEGGKRASKMKKDREGVFTRLYSRSDGSLDRTARSSRFFSSPTSSGDDVSLPSIRSGTGASTYRGGRKKQLDLPSEFRTPGPGDYRIASTIGKTPGASFKGNRERSFGNAKSSNAVFLLPRLVNDTPSPGQYEVRSDMGSGLKSTFPRSKRDSRFIGDKNSNAGFIVNRAIDANPAPNKYKQRSTIGADPFDPVSPRSNALSFSRAQRESNFPGALNAKFLLPKVIPKYPAPTSYQSGASSFANSYLTRGSTFSHARRNARFSGDYRAKFLLLS